MTLLINILSYVMLLGGALVVVIGALGMIRMPDFYTRLHALSVIDTLGCMLISLGLILQAGLSLASIKLFLIIIFILFTSPAAAHALAKSALHGHHKPMQFKSGEQSSNS